MRRLTVVLAAVVALAVVTLAVAAGWGPGSAAPRGDDPVLVTYVRIGGVAGDRTALTVTTDGAATLEGERGAGQVGWTRQVPDDRMDALRSSLESAGFGELAPSYAPAGVFSDCFLDQVRYGGVAVTVEGGTGPDELAGALRLLRELAAG